MKEKRSKSQIRQGLAAGPKKMQRWISIKNRRRASTLVRWIMRWRLPLREKKKNKILEAAFITAKNEAINFEHSKLQSSSTIFNIVLYFLLAERDIQCFKVDALTHKDEWRRKLSARVILLTMHELDLDKVTGQKLQNALVEMGISDETKKEVREALRLIRKVQQKIRKEFSFVRNNAIAHRYENALVQYREIRNLNVLEVLGVAAEFYEHSDKFIGALTKIMKEGSTMTSLIRQWSRANSLANPPKEK